MKKSFLFFVFILVLQMVYCNDTIPSRIYFYREPAYQAAAVTYRIYSGAELVGKLKNSSYFIYDCQPGDYEFHVNNMTDSQVKFRAEGGKTYFCRFSIRMGFWTAIPELILVDSISAWPAINSGNMKETDGLNLNAPRPKNRLGVDFDLGLGFEDIPMVTLINGDESTIAFGGGIGIGATYGYEISRHFDISLSAAYQFSSLQPYVKNASVSFGRGVFAVTPAYIIPVGAAEVMRIKLGGGLQWCFSPKLEIKTASLMGGFNDDWTYGNSMGFHVSGIFEIDFSDKWSAVYGLKYYNLGYSFEKAGISTPLDNRLIKPDGSGIDLVLGIYFHF